MPKLRRNQKLTCVPCGRVVTVSSSGASRGTIWCCSRPMQQKTKAAPKKKAAKRKATKRKTTKRKTAKRRVVRKKTARRRVVKKKTARKKTTARRRRK